MKQKISEEVEEKWKESCNGWKKIKEHKEKKYNDARQKICDVWTRQTDGGYPPPINKGFFWASFLCPSCNTRLDIEECIVGIIAVCPKCEYSYLEVCSYEAKIFMLLLDEFDENEKGKTTEPVH